MFFLCRWPFSCGLLMMALSPCNLHLTATYGFVVAAAVIALGMSLGWWIDATRRLTAVRTRLIIQNSVPSRSAQTLFNL